MTLNQLGYFYQAAVLQHFNQAAEKMNISEPSLSRSISSLEDELGVTLFEKRGRNVILTKAGEIFLEHATQILDDVKRAENKMHHLATDGGHIDIAYVSPLAREYIPRTVRNFLSLEQNKNITFNFNQDITSVNIEGLKKGAYDLIFGSYSANEPNIEFVPIIKQEIVAILPAGHPLSRKEALQAADFADYQVLGYNRHSGLASTHAVSSKNTGSHQISSANPRTKTELPPLWHRGLGLHLWLTLTPSTATTSVSAP